ncbi:unnamed protein product [Ambrosiozyma monospora]|uniref:Aldehyde dehydrogenase n=1 Tax=Ambrosiozyma monospora TaxID=43982 RepID=A0A9W7DI79_AMBMO|nr:unnamed protein product [Ambrosiozyma monospora]
MSEQVSAPATRHLDQPGTPSKLELTKTTEIPTIINNLKQRFTESQTTSTKQKSTEIKVQLQKLRSNLIENKDELESSLAKDFHKPKLETCACELGPLLSEIDYFLKNVDSIISGGNEKPDKLAFTFSTLTARVERIALGVILIVAPFNYPLLLSLGPVIGAIGCGNRVILKLPTDQIPSFCETLTINVLQKSFDDGWFTVMNGGLDVAQNLTSVETVKLFDKVVFTGSTRVGGIVASNAGVSCTPVLLELGGKSPVFVTSNCKDLQKAANRILWGKFTNAGQTCVAVDYLVVEDDIYDEFLEILKTNFDNLFNSISSDTDFAHLINNSAFNRISKYMETTKGTLISPKDSKKPQKETNFFPPTLITDVDFTDSLMKEELFGPILPIIKYNSLSNVIESIKTHHDTPLALYIFSDNYTEQDLIKASIQSGAVGINEVMMHAGCMDLPFGGIGNSGYGHYHGKYSIDAFTHRRAIIKQPYWAEAIIGERYMPYNATKASHLWTFIKCPDVPLKLGWVFKYLAVFGAGVLLGWVLNTLFIVWIVDYDTMEL